MATSRPPAIIDNGTGYTKMGYAGNYQPNFIVPTVISTIDEKMATTSGMSTRVADLDFYIGDEAMKKRAGYNIDYPIKHGTIRSWDNMEKFWQRCIFQYMRFDPEEHYVMLTEPPLNSPENREYTAEVMFETFSVPGLYIAVQAVLALCAAKLSSKKAEDASVTGTVIDSGDGVTHIIPVVEGYVIGSCIKHIPLAGRDVTNFILQFLRDRGENIPSEDQLSVARIIKEKYCYVCKDLVEEYKAYDEDQLAGTQKKFKTYSHTHKKTGKTYPVDVGYERFLGPEIFFTPEMFSEQFATPLAEVCDSTILKCPIDTIRSLYKFITLSGGSTMFKNFAPRLQRDIRKKTEARDQKRAEAFKDIELRKMEVKVIKHKWQRFAVWFGGSMLSSQPQFLGKFHTREQYEEEGPRIARASRVFSDLAS
mmetsp:Transcript_15630/g.31693  ORF Transcript_15630/g.31693 Transcript_15630/m.31693 type:complete len:422 (-) Transcript_15630:104-1369(-)|eukprot:CAMPEP_0167787906 /NCGR_PEP_ID=MMETSP0111_2-20121227/9708_1 /TAXON_ID=91324 /ORGANISM="Lotharella globosa, Strain CCCM811" /LENGTH=421 /DNA_ID=CAMNT_0007679651 /DNA_START=36 /DNA_END=1301 /DNA_ORIENTATION=+